MKFSAPLLRAVHVLALFAVMISAKKVKKLEISVIRASPDCSMKAENGDEVAVHYTGSLDDGKVFDSSVMQKRDPIVFTLGKKMVIPGWEQGIEGMCVGEKRKLVIPSDLGYGKKGYPPVIPPDATLTFETELMSVRKTPVEGQIVEVLKFLAYPALGAYILYYLYNKYQADAAKSSSKKESKKSKRK